METDYIERMKKIGRDVVTSRTEKLEDVIESNKEDKRT